MSFYGWSAGGWVYASPYHDGSEPPGVATGPLIET